MEEKNIINDEVMETVEDCVPSGGSGIGGKILGGALVAGLAFAGYKLIKKFKANKESNDYVQIDGDYDEDEDVIDEEMVEELKEKLN